MDQMDMISIFVSLLTWCFSCIMCDPTGCTYHPSRLKYECTSRSWVLPLTLSDFDNTPQSISLVDINGDLPAAAPNGPTFSGFDLINVTTFDVNFVPTFTIRCIKGGMLIFSSDSFTGLDYIKEIFIQNCEVLAIPDEAFKHFVEVNYLGFEGGNIGDIGYNAFKGLNIYPMAVPHPRGAFVLKNSKLDSKVLPNGVLYALANVSILEIENVNLKTVPVDMFQATTKVTYLSLRENLFTSLPTMILSSMEGLSAVDLGGILWECSCDNLWILEYCQTNNITLHGPVICNQPANYWNKKGFLYEREECPNYIQQCGDQPSGFAVMETCLSYIQLVDYVILLVIITIVTVAMALTCHTLRQLREENSVMDIRTENLNEIENEDKNKVENEDKNDKENEDKNDIENQIEISAEG